MKKFFSLLAAVLMAGSMMATDYQKVTTAPSDWSGEYVIAATASDGKALVWTGVDAGQCRDSVVVTDGKISGDNFVTVTVEAMDEGYSIKVNGGANDGKYISSGTSAPTYSNGLKFITTATRVDFAFNEDATVAMSQTISGNADANKNGTMYLLYNKNSGVNNERYRFYKGTNYNTDSYLTPCLYKKVSAPAPVINYWLVGPAAENGWDQTKAMPMPGDSIVRHLNAGTYEFKVLTQEGSWTGALGAADVNATASSANWYGDGNVCFELENESDVTIKVVEGQIVLLGTFKKQESYDYYIKFAGNNWTWVGMTQAPSGYYMYEGVWGGVGANVNTSMSDNGAAWFPEANIMFLDESMEELPVPAVGTEGIYVYMQYTEPVLAFIYEGTPAGWDGTVTLSKTTINSIADLEGITLTFNGATTVEFLGADADILALQNEDGSEMYAGWHPEYGGSYTINGNVVTLTGWLDNTEAAPLPQGNATLYVEDYGAFRIDGVADYFETAEVAYEAAEATTYTVTYTVTGADGVNTAASAGYYSLVDETVFGQLEAGDNTIPENVYVYIQAVAVEGYSYEVTVNGEAITMDNYWTSASVITANTNIVVTFKKDGGEGGNTTVSKTMLEVVNENEFTLSAGNNAVCYTSFPLDEVVTVSTTGEPNCGSFWTNTLGTDWRLYQAKNGNVTITLAEGYELVSITIDYTNQNDGELTGLPYNTKDTNVSGSTKTYTVGNSGTKTNGQVRIQSITVEYKTSGTPTALENVEAVKAVKTIENGQLYIIRNGVKYNVNGMRVK